jgi:hypothetical protein
MLQDQKPKTAQKRSDKVSATIRCIACRRDCSLSIGRLVATRNTLVVECPWCKCRFALDIEARRLTTVGD